MKSKIFFIIPYLTKGGAQRVVCNLGNHFSRNGYMVVIVVLNDCEVGYTLEKDIKVIHLFKERRSTFFLSRLFHAGASFSKLIWYVKKASPDHLVAFTTTANMWAGITGTILKIPYIVSERTVPSRTISQFNPCVKRFVQYLYKNASAIVSPSKGIQKELENIPLLKNLDNYHIIKNPVTTFEPITGVSVHPRSFILAVGRLVEVKGFDMLIKSFAQLKSKNLDLIIVGDGPSRGSLTDLIATLGLSSSVYLPGRTDNMQDYYDQCEVFVLSSRNEGYPNVLIEAMSNGCACIAFNCETGPADIIENGFNGFLVENGNIGLLTQAIDILMADADLREQLSLNARKIGKSNSINEIALQWEKLISPVRGEIISTELDHIKR